MKKPLDRGVAIDAQRFSRWMSQFSGYRNPVTNGLVELWLDQFSAGDRDLAARILDAVLFIGDQHIHTRFRELLGALEGWDKVKAKRHAQWFFVPFSGSTGESGDSMVHAFRMATSMTSKHYNDLFIHRSELVSRNPGPDDTVVLIDDFSGTGNQACDSWHIFSELLTGGPRVILMLIAATHQALQRITDKTEMQPVCGTTLRSKDNIYHADCTFFSHDEKNRLLKYCASADAVRPRGYGDCGLLVVFAHRCPNNTIPILHANSAAWQALFPRDD
jgi:hypothetical protein